MKLIFGNAFYFVILVLGGGLGASTYV